MKARVLAAVAACGVLGLVLLGHDDASAPRVAAASHADVPTVPVAAPPAVARIAPSIPRDDTVYPVDPTPATVEAPLTEEERDPRIARGIEMLDAAVVRAEANLAKAEAAGDQAAANTARVRINRLRDVRKQRANAPEATQ